MSPPGADGCAGIGEFLAHQLRMLGIEALLATEGVTEICINRPGEVHVERHGQWSVLDAPALTFERARHFCISVVNESATGQRITDVDPMVSLTLPNGARAQLVLPPVCPAGTVSITLRIPVKVRKHLDDYAREGFFDEVGVLARKHNDNDAALQGMLDQGDHAGFFREAVKRRKNIVVSGATGSGKTTFMKALVEHVPACDRLITIEDAREIELSQPNHVHLLYSKNAQGGHQTSAKSCLEACLRMRPDRILLAELRGDEAFYFIRNCASGHPGAITSCHAGSAAQTWTQLALMVKASPEGASLDMCAIRVLLEQTIDVIVHVHAQGGHRRISDLLFVRRA